MPSKHEQPSVTVPVIVLTSVFVFLLGAAIVPLRSEPHAQPHAVEVQPKKKRKAKKARQPKAIEERQQDRRFESAVARY